MSKGQYNTVKYVGQEFHRALRRLFEKRGYRGIPMQHNDNEGKGESVLFYSVAGSEVRVSISRTPKNYHFNVQAGLKGSHDLETKADRDLELKRSKRGVLLSQCMDSLALESFRILRAYHQSRQTK